MFKEQKNVTLTLPRVGITGYSIRASRCDVQANNCETIATDNNEYTCTHKHVFVAKESSFCNT
eukprot:832165-Amphidinium_carterae.2